MGAIWDLQMSPTQKSVLVSLADQANDSGLCWPSIDTICRRTCLGERTVQRALHELQEVGLVQRILRQGHSTHYLVTTPATAAPPSERHPATAAPTPATAPPQPPPERHLTPATAAPRTVREPSDEPSRNRQGSPAAVHKTARRALPDPECPKELRMEEAAQAALPEVIPRQAWADFVEMRYAKKQPMTARMVQLVIDKLLKLRAGGDDPGEVLVESTVSRWTGVFPLKRGSMQRPVDTGGQNYNEGLRIAK